MLGNLLVMYTFKLFTLFITFVLFYVGQLQLIPFEDIIDSAHIWTEFWGLFHYRFLAVEKILLQNGGIQ